MAIRTWIDIQELPRNIVTLIDKDKVTLIGHDSSENFFFLCMITVCGFLTFDFEVM